jgi:VCBS repeat-containing protein
LAPLVRAVVGILLSLSGVNASNPNPTNPFQQLLFSLAKGLNDALNPAPPPGTPTIGTPDPTSGAVTGSLGFPAGDGLTFTTTEPSRGAVIVTTDGTYTYTPTQSARQAAGEATTDTFVATVHNGLSTNSVTVTVPVDPGTPVASAPVVGEPNAASGVVTGNADGAHRMSPGVLVEIPHL